VEEALTDAPRLPSHEVREDELAQRHRVREVALPRQIAGTLFTHSTRLRSRLRRARAGVLFVDRALVWVTEVANVRDDH